MPKNEANRYYSQRAILSFCIFGRWFKLNFGEKNGASGYLFECHATFTLLSTVLHLSYIT